jgi:hypothetical protein
MKKISAPVAAALGTGVACLFMFVAGWLLPPPRNLQAECEKTCRPLPAAVVPDPNYPKPAGGKPGPKLCRCG